MTHELHTRFSAIRAGTTSKRSQDRGGAVSRAMASLRYGLRDTAAGTIAYSGKDLDELPGGNRKAMRRYLRLAFHSKIREAGGRGGKTGARVMETAHITFPSSWPHEARHKAMKRVCALYAPPGSEALALAVEHTDKPGNPHFHLYSLNGLESKEAAAKRAAETGKRPRRRLVNRLGDLGGPKMLRAAIAAQMNAVADELGLERVEHRTLKSRGIEREPKHMSQAAHRAAKEAAEKAVETPTPSMPTPPPPAPAAAPKVRKIRKGGRWITITEKPAFEDAEMEAYKDLSDQQEAAWKAYNAPKKGKRRDGPQR